ncbi:hypothetical protein GS622_14635 [Ruegeria sp. HKCCD6109]|nr:hypothetical protein [Ruegeria sp. HKCCD6109]
MRLLERLIGETLAEPESGTPLCLFRANVIQTRRWDASDQQILIKYNCKPEDDLESIKSIAPKFHDPRYITKHRAPILTVNRLHQLIVARESAQIWRGCCASNGMPKTQLTCAN